MSDWPSASLLFKRYLQDDGNAVQPLFSFLEREVQRFLRRKGLHGDQIDDLTQTVLLKVHTARDRFDPRQSLRNWVYTISERTLIDHWRRGRLDVADDADDIVDQRALSPEHRVISHRELHQLEKRLKKLNPIDSQIVHLCGVENQSVKTVSQQLDLTPNAVKIRLHRARKFLRGTIVLLLAML